MRRHLFSILALLALALCAHAQNPATGFPPYGSFDRGEFDTVNLQDLNFNFAIPTATSPGRGIDFNFAVVYNSLNWVIVNNAWTPVLTSNWGWQLTSPTGQVSYKTLHGHQRCGFIDGLPAYIDTTTYNGYQYVDPLGTIHVFTIFYTDQYNECTQVDTISATYTGYATDGSAYYSDISVDPTAPTIVSPAGIVVGNSFLRDTNGNSITSSNPQPGETDWTDTAGHVAMKIISGTSSIQYKVLDPTGNYQTTTLNFATFNIKTSFNCSGVIDYTGTANLPQSVVLPNGQKYQFAYEPNSLNSGYYTGRLQQVTLPTEGTVQYISYLFPSCSDGSYTDLTRKVSDGTNSSTWSFSRTQINSSQWQTTETTPIPPYGNQAGQTKVVFNLAGQETQRLVYDYSGILLRTVNTTWAANGTPATRTVILDDGRTQSETETTFDSFGNLQVFKEHDWGNGSPGQVGRTTTLAYLNTSSYVAANILNRPTSISVVNAAGTVQLLTKINYDESGYINATCIPNSNCTSTIRGNPTSTITYVDPVTPANPVTRNLTYDSAGNVIKSAVDGKQQKQWSYSSTTNYSYPDSETDGPSSGPQLTKNIAYNVYTGQISSIKDPNNQTISFIYDFMKRLKTVTRPDGAQIGYAYVDATPPAQSQVAITTPVVQGSSSVVQTISYDGLARPVQKTIQDGSQNTYSIVQTQYDPLGHAYKVSNPFTATAQYWTETDLDVLDRVTKVLMPDQSKMTYTYSTNSVTTTDPAGKQKQIFSNALGRTSAVYEPDPNNGNSLTQYTSYAYTVVDNISSVTEGQQSRTYGYDGLGRLISVATPETVNAAVQYQYNDLDFVTQRTDARGVVTNYSYDTLNRRIGISYALPQGSQVAAMPNVCNPVAGQNTPVDNVCFYYDEGGAAANALGRLTHISYALGNQQNPPVGTETYHYDAVGRHTQAQKSLSGQTYTVGYQYNSADELTLITYPSNRAIQQNYDPIGRLAKVSDASATYLTIPAIGGYNSASELLTMNYGNGAAGNLQYSPDRLQLTGLSYTKGTNTLFSLAYSYGATGSNNGQISGITDNVDNGRTLSYIYDALGRVTNAATVGSTNYPKWGLSWTFDRYGNRKTQSISSGCVAPMTCPTNSLAPDPATNRVCSSPYACDGNGNLTNDGQNALAYDAENRGVTSAGSLGSGTYIYDGNGLRVERTSSGTTTVYVFSGSRVIAEYASGGAPGSPAKEYVYSGSDLLAALSGGTTTYVHPDHLSARVLTDSNANIIGQQAHYPFGESWYAQNAITKWQFTSYERDTESINDYATARSYVNRLGRFSSPDLLGGDLTNPQSLNLYTYALNDPCSLIDPLGLKPCTVTVRIKIKKNAVNPDQLKVIEQRIQAVFAATSTDNGDTFNVTFVDSGKANYTLTLDPGAPANREGLAWWGPFAFAKVYIGTEIKTYAGSGNKNDAYVSAGTDAAHELTHRIGHIGDLRFNQKDTPDLMNVNSAITQNTNDSSFRLPSDPYSDNINPIGPSPSFAKLSPKQVQRLIDKSHCKEPSGSGSAVGDLPRPPPYRREDD